jgi:hypothetical protein
MVSALNSGVLVRRFESRSSQTDDYKWVLVAFPQRKQH